MASPDQLKSRTDGEQKLAPSVITLPKGGGAIRGMGEKFAANPVTGTAAMSVPIALSPARSGFAPQLSLNYESGSGNGPFGFGWSLSLPAITRKTDKGLPQYRDADESDVYVLSGAEDLVPVLQPSGQRFEDDTSFPGYVIHRYRPRVEGLFARIERWTNVKTHETHWRLISHDNVTSLYGKDNNCRIFDPEDPFPANPTRIFAWHICESYDDKGNAITYEYARESEENVDCGQASERNRVRVANRYIKRIKYGNRVSRLMQPDLSQTAWLFEVVFDYDEAHYEEVGLDPTRPESEQHRFVRCSNSVGRPWSIRPDPFSSYRASFEVRSYRRCRRILMFHHIPDLSTGEPGYDGLVRSIEFDYADLDYGKPVAIEDELLHQGSSRFASFIRKIIQSGYLRDDTHPVAVSSGVQYVTYLKKSVPPVEFEYSKPVIRDQVLDVDVTSLENLPEGLQDTMYQWADLDGEGISGILTEQAGAWFYKPNLGGGRFGPLTALNEKPSFEGLSSGRQKALDVAGNGRLDVVILEDDAPGFYERTIEGGWEPFRTFRYLPNIPWDEPNLLFVDLNGDGHADVLIAEQNVFTWYPSLAEEGFGPARSVSQPFDEDRGPRLVLADTTQSLYLADMCGDGLTDLVRIRNGEVCYWPNLGYGRFGAKVTMDNSPWFDNPDEFDQQRVRLADIDGSGTSDIIYLARNGVRLYFNQSGNRISEAYQLRQFPPVDNVSSVMTVDLLGKGTACLVWSSSLPTDARRPLRYIDLMGGIKPHLLIKSTNNLGAETNVSYESSTRFYLADKRDGRPWLTRLPFPVHVVNRVVTRDGISGNEFVTSYTYRHGYFDGIEREFRGFGLVEQLDTEQFDALRAGEKVGGTNVDKSSNVPPVLTKTWFHTGVSLGSGHVSDAFAGLLDTTEAGEYYCEPGLSNVQARTRLLENAKLADGLTANEEREACRALKGLMLRQEIYALDGTGKQQTPYTVTEQNYGVRLQQPRGSNRHAVFFTHVRESIVHHYERDPADPRIDHTLTLEVDEFGNTLKSAAIGYGRRRPDTALSLADRATQAKNLITYAENLVTNKVDSSQDYRTPLPCDTRNYELTGLAPSPGSDRFNVDEILAAGTAAAALDYEKVPTEGRLEKRLIEHVRTYYRRDDLAESLALGELQSLALPFESYKLAFTPGLVSEVYGVRVSNAMLESEGRYVHTEGGTSWWIPSGRVFYSANSADTPSVELTNARQHFFLPVRYRDPFHSNALSTESFVAYDDNDLLVYETRDALGNRITAGERQGVLSDGTVLPERRRHDYRVLQPTLVMDPNRNCSEVRFDATGMVVGSAVMGKPEESPRPGDRLKATFRPDLTQAEIDQLFANPKGAMASTLLDDATTRIVYDFNKLPAVAATIAREVHVSNLLGSQTSKLQISFCYSDGFGREIQRKSQAEPGPVPMRDSSGKIIVGADGQPQMTPYDVGPRWVGSGWTVFNNKGKPVRKYEPFFTDVHRFEFDVRIGVSPILFYDPVGRVVASLSPNNTWDKVVFDPWRQQTWDVNDTVLNDPKTDADVGAFFSNLPDADYLPTWHALRTDPANATAFATRYPDPADRANQTLAARKAGVHAVTPKVTYADSLGRTFLTTAHNKFKYSDTQPADPPVEEFYSERIFLDIEGNQRQVTDAKDRVVMRYAYDMLGHRIHQLSMEAGARWMLNDVVGGIVRSWDSRGHNFASTYDALRRPVGQTVNGTTSDSDPRTLNRVILVEKIEYGEITASAESLNLRSRVYRHFDSAGAIINARLDPNGKPVEAFDFKGNLLRKTQRLVRDYAAIPDWSTDPQLDAETFEGATRYDALNREIQSIALHSNAERAKRNILQQAFNEASLLKSVDVWLERAAEPGGLLNPSAEAPSAVGISNVDYDAKGQRLRITYKNGANTIRNYDPRTLQCTRILTQRPSAAFPDDDPQPPDSARPGRHVQNLYYTWDPVGNITNIRDDAQQTIFFRNRRVEPSNDYTYDAVYRLIEATGREHLGLAGGERAPPTVPDGFNAFHTRLGHPGDGNAVGTYVERYQYDPVGNFLQMQHRGSDPVHPGWRRTFEYGEPSLIENGAGGGPLKISNRLTRNTLSNGLVEEYQHDAHGNMVRMPHLGSGLPGQNMRWDYKDRLRQTDMGGGGTAFYVYDALGQRVRKVWQKTPALVEERIYLGGFEIFRSHGGPIGPNTATLERETLHLTDTEHRVALVETRTLDATGSDPAPRQLIRYQFGNHLGSASLELDERAQIISYEEYAPYGSTTYQAVRSQTEVRKRYRFTGKERDEESGLYYHGARYYAPWLGRWTSCDPLGLVDGSSLYLFVRNNPVRYRDPTGMYSWREFGEDVGRVNKLAGILMPGVAAAQAAGTAIAGRVGEAVTGKSASDDGQGATQLSGTERVEAATDALISATPVGPIHQASKSAAKAIGRAIKGSISKSEVAVSLAKLEPTGIVSKTFETAEAFDRAEVVSNSGDGGDKARAYIDAGLSFVDLVQTGASLVLGAGEGKGSQGGKTPSPPPPNIPPAVEALPRMSAPAALQHVTGNVYAELIVKAATENPGAYAIEMAENPYAKRDFGNLLQERVNEAVANNVSMRDEYLPIKQNGRSVPDFLHTGSETGRPFAELTTTRRGTVVDHTNRWYGPYSDLILYLPLPDTIAAQEVRLQNWMTSRGL